MRGAVLIGVLAVACRAPVSQGTVEARGALVAPRAGLPWVPLHPHGAALSSFTQAATLRLDATGAWLATRGAPAQGWVVHVAPEGSAVEPKPEEPLGVPVRVYLGNDPAGREARPSYGSARYREVAPGIDWIVSPERRGLAFRVEVRAGAWPGTFALRIEGATGARVDPERATLTTPLGEYAVSPPIAWQADTPRTARFLDPEPLGAGVWRLGIAVDGVDPSLPLVIDPAIVWASYLGGSAAELCNGVALVGPDDPVITGLTTGTFPTTPGAFDTTRSGFSDIFVSRARSDGTALIWATLLGGNDADDPTAIRATPGGDLWLTGVTYSTDFPAIGGFDSTLGGAWDAIAARFDASGQLVYSTYLGGPGDERGQDLALGPNGDVYIVGDSSSTTGFATPGAWRANLPGGGDGFAARIPANGAAPVYVTYVGGAMDAEFTSAVAVDSTGAAWVGGSTRSPDFPLVAAFNTTPPGNEQGFVLRLLPDGSGVTLSSFLGGPSTEEVNGFAIGPGDDLFVVGASASTGFATPGAYDTTFGGTMDAFILRISGGQPVWATYVGAADVERFEVVVVPSVSNVVCAAGAASATGTPLVNPIDTTFAGSADGLIACVTLDGVSPRFVSFLGGSALDTLNGITSTAAGDLFVTANTTSTNFPGISGFDTTLGSDDAAIARIAAVFMVIDAGPPDAGPPDAGGPDAGASDAGTPDAGSPDAGAPDAGTADAGPTDGGFDAGPVLDGGPRGGPIAYPVGCGCGAFPNGAWLGLLVLVALRRFRR